MTDEYYMERALREADRAAEQDEVPVGAIMVHQDTLIARTYNSCILLTDPTAHAEILAITSATQALNCRYLNHCTLYVTLEPCVMCAGALAWSRIGRIVFGAYDDKRGVSTVSTRIYHPQTEVIGGILEAECGKKLSLFFSKKREEK